MRERNGRDALGITGQELNHVCGQAGLEQDAVEERVREDCVRGGLPDDDVAEQGGQAGQVAGDGGEVEGRDGVDETFERAVFQAAVQHVLLE